MRNKKSEWVPVERVGGSARSLLSIPRGKRRGKLKLVVTAEILYRGHLTGYLKNNKKRESGLGRAEKGGTGDFK